MNQETLRLAMKIRARIECIEECIADCHNQLSLLHRKAQTKEEIDAVLKIMKEQLYRHDAHDFTNVAVLYIERDLKEYEDELNSLLEKLNKL